LSWILIEMEDFNLSQKLRNQISQLAATKNVSIETLLKTWVQSEEESISQVNNALNLGRFPLRLLEASRASIIICDAQQRGLPVLYVNRACLEMIGYSDDDFIGRSCSFLQNDDRDQDELVRLRQALRNGESIEVTLRNYRKNGDLFYNLLFISPVFNENNHLTHYIGIQNDITDRIVAQNELEQLGAFQVSAKPC